MKKDSLVEAWKALRTVVIVLLVLAVVLAGGALWKKEKDEKRIEMLRLAQVAQEKRELVYQKQVWKAEDEKRAADLQAELQKIREDGKARIKASREDFLEGLKKISLPENYAARKREVEKEWEELDARLLQEAQLQELREIKAAMGK